MHPSPRRHRRTGSATCDGIHDHEEIFVESCDVEHALIDALQVRAVKRGSCWQAATVDATFAAVSMAKAAVERKCVSTTFGRHRELVVLGLFGPERIEQRIEPDRNDG